MVGPLPKAKHTQQEKVETLANSCLLHRVFSWYIMLILTSYIQYHTVKGSRVRPIWLHMRPKCVRVRLTFFLGRRNEAFVFSLTELTLIISWFKLIGDRDGEGLCL